MDIAELIIKILSSLNWNSLLGIVGGALSAWFMYRVQERQANTAETDIMSTASSRTVKDLLDTLKYKEAQLDDLRAQLENEEERRRMNEAELRSENEERKKSQEALEEIVEKALARIDELEGIEKAYRRLVRYARALEKELAKLGVDWDTVDVTRMMFMVEGDDDENDSGAVVHDDLMAERECGEGP